MVDPNNLPKIDPFYHCKLLIELCEEHTVSRFPSIMQAARELGYLGSDPQVLYNTPESEVMNNLVHIALIILTNTARSALAVRPIAEVAEIVESGVLNTCNMKYIQLIISKKLASMNTTIEHLQLNAQEFEEFSRDVLVSIACPRSLTLRDHILDLTITKILTTRPSSDNG